MAKTTGFTIRGGTEMRDKLRLIIRAHHTKVERAMVAEMNIELKEVVARTPRLTGLLRGSEHIEGPTWNWQRVSVDIVAGGPDVPYAIKVHEDLEAIHPVGQAKFLESVLFESRASMGSRIASRCKLSMSDIE